MAVSKERWRVKDRVKRFITDNGSGNMIYTPVKVVDSMLDLLPEEIWGNKDAKFLDICSKSGVFLERIYWRLEQGLKKEIPNFTDRSDHILTKQLFGIAPSEDYAEIARGIVYGTYRADHQRAFTDKFSNRYGNIKVMERVIDGYKNDIFEIIKEQTGEMFKDTIKEAFGDMKFDVIIGNPPYQENDGGGGDGKSASPLYNRFVDKAIEINSRYILMVIPARWYTGGAGTENFRNMMINNRHIKSMVDYQKSSDVFDGVIINGGVCYFLYDRMYSGECEFTTIVKGLHSKLKRKLNEFDIFIRDNRAVNIINKVMSKKEKYFDTVVSSCMPFGIETNIRGDKDNNKNKITLVASDGITYISDDKITKNRDLIDKYKVIVNRVANSVEADKDGMYPVIRTMRVIGKAEVCTKSFIIIGASEHIKQVENIESYIKTKFARLLLLQATASITLSKEKFRFVPIQDFSKSWTDAELYAKYNLTQEEIDFIESMIKPME